MAANGHVSASTVDPAGRVVETREPTGEVARCAYDAVGNLTRVENSRGTATEEAEGDGVIRFSYDAAAGRLASVRTLAATRYSLDEVGNLVEVATDRGRRSYRYDERDRLVGACLEEPPAGQAALGR